MRGCGPTTTTTAIMSGLASLVDFSDPTLYRAALIVALCPTIWNIVARYEFYTRRITKLCGGNKYVGCYLLAAWIIGFSMYRDRTLFLAESVQPTAEFLGGFFFQALAVILFCTGGIFVLSSYYRLGITGTYLGDYFGILMDEKVTAFPFNVLDNPMYMGATMIHLGKAIWHKSPAGILLSGVIFVVYRIAIIFEGSFTNYIYSMRDKERQKEKGANKKAGPSAAKNASSSEGDSESDSSSSSATNSSNNKPRVRKIKKID